MVELGMAHMEGQRRHHGGNLRLGCVNVGHLLIQKILLGGPTHVRDHLSS